MNQLIMIILISLLVLVHEIGHFVAAKIFGVKVTRFGIGMPVGPSWKLFKWGDTVFYLHAFLFGGYVSFAEPEPSELSESLASEGEGKDVWSAKAASGELGAEHESLIKGEPSELSESLASEGEQNKTKQNEDETLPADSPELYDNKTIAQKLIIVSAGVIMNVVFAVLLVIFAAAYFQKLPASTQNIYVDSFSNKTTSNIEKSGITKGDKFTKINNKKINSLYQLTFFAKNSKLFDNYAQKDLIDENLEELKKLNPNIKNQIEANKIIHLPSPKAEQPLDVNENVLKGLEKYKKEGVELTKTQIELRNDLYNKTTYKTKTPLSLNDIATALSDTYKPINITILRNGKELTFNNIQVNKEGMLGVMLKIEDVYTETKTPKQIISKSINYLYTTTTTMLYSLWQLITGKVSASDMHGVIAVVKVGGDIIASKGMLNGILLTAMISINLAIMNFLPIPALDGGHVMFLVIEKLTGKKPDKEFSDKINNFFFILLIILMISICYNDIFALIIIKL